MALSDAMDELINILSVEWRVHRIPPTNIGTPKGVLVILLPPARSTPFRQGRLKQKRYDVQVTVMHVILQDEKGPAEAVSEAVEQIDDLLDSHLTLAGSAVVIEPITWEQATLTEYPANTGQIFASMVGNLAITIELPAAVAA